MDKRVVIIAVVVLLLVFVGGGAFFILGKTKNSMISPTPAPTSSIIPTLTPDEIGLNFIATPDKKKVKLSISNLNGVAVLDYIITYDADSPDDPSIKVPRGTSGENIQIEEGQETFETDYIDLGSCSSGRCKYYSGIEEINLLVKITKTDGTVHQVEDILEL